MNRRSFLKSLFTGVATLATLDIDILISYTSRLTDDEFQVFDFITYYKVTINLYVSNPRKVAYITNIVE